MPKLNIVSIAALALVAVGIWKTYAPLLRDKDAIVALTRSTEEVTGEKILAKVNAAKGKPSLVYLYASWCKACRTTTPLLASYARNRRLAEVSLVFVAMEHDGYSLAAYLQDKGYDGLWLPYFATELDAIWTSLTPATSAKGIPLLMGYDNKGKLVVQKQGGFTAQELDTLLDSITPRRRP